MFVCFNVRMLTSPPVLKLWGTQGYLWLPYDLTEVIKLIGETFEPKNIFFFKKILYVIPSALVSFLPYYCHSFRIIVIPSVLVSFLPNIVIPSELFTLKSLINVQHVYLFHMFCFRTECCRNQNN